MGKLRSALGWCFSNWDKFTLLAAWLMGLSVPPWLLSLSEHATPIQYLAAAGAGVLVVTVIFAVFWKGRALMIDSKLRARRIGSSPGFDPMATVYERQRLHLADLAPVGRTVVAGKRFIDCEIIGPGNIVVAIASEGKPFPAFQGNVFWDVDMIQIEAGKKHHNSIRFYDCDFLECNFYHLNLLFFERFRDDWNWITPVPAQGDFKVIENATGSDQSEIQPPAKGDGPA